MTGSATPTAADAVLDRLVHNAYKIDLKDSSRRTTNTNSKGAAPTSVRSAVSMAARSVSASRPGGSTSGETHTEADCSSLDALRER
jgi:hypothetical protein